MKWSTVVTTAPRQECTLVQTLESLEDCGWSPVVFAEPGATPTNRLTFWNEKRLGVWSNWLKSCRWALDQYPDFVLTVQDDSEFHPDSKEFIESLDWPSNAGYISLYTPKHYQLWKNGTPRPIGLYPINTNSMWGACALVFKPDVLSQLINHPRAASWVGVRCRDRKKWPELKAKRLENSHLIQNSDTIIGSILTKSLGKKLYYLNPSPCSHIARHSAIGHGGNKGKRNAHFIADHSIPLKSQIFSFERTSVSMEKIALVLNNWGTFGGTATYHKALVSALADSGYEVSVCIPYPNEKWSLPPLPFKIYFGEEAIKECQKSPTWIVWALGKNLLQLMKRKKTQPRIITISHGDGSSELSRRCLLVESKHSSRIVVVSKAGIESIPENARNISTIIYPFVDTKRLVPVTTPSEIRRSTMVSEDDKILLFLGRICKGKRIDFVLEVARRLPEAWKLLVVGGESDAISVSSIFGNHKVRFCGPTLHPGDYIQIADCLISPSISEGFGLSVVEAALKGVPVVACKSGILNELSIGTVLGPEASVEDFANAVINSSSAKAEEDRKSVQFEFSYDVFRKSWEETCRQ